MVFIGSVASKYLLRSDVFFSYGLLLIDHYLALIKRSPENYYGSFWRFNRLLVLFRISSKIVYARTQYKTRFYTETETFFSLSWPSPTVRSALIVANWIVPVWNEMLIFSNRTFFRITFSSGNSVAPAESQELSQSELSTVMRELSTKIQTFIVTNFSAAPFTHEIFARI